MKKFKDGGTQCCANCWFSEKDIDNQIDLECHVSEPRLKEDVDFDGSKQWLTLWPTVPNDQWCGRWKDSRIAKKQYTLELTNASLMVAKEGLL